jgi:hypothetical protein
LKIKTPPARRVHPHERFRPCIVSSAAAIMAIKSDVEMEEGHLPSRPGGDGAFRLSRHLAAEFMFDEGHQARLVAPIQRQPSVILEIIGG